MAKNFEVRLEWTGLLPAGGVNMSARIGKFVASEGDPGRGQQKVHGGVYPEGVWVCMCVCVCVHVCMCGVCVCMCIVYHCIIAEVTVLSLSLLSH